MSDKGSGGRAEWFLAALARIAEANEPAAGWAAFEAFREALGFEYAAYGPFFSSDTGQGLLLDHASETIRPAIEEYVETQVDRSDPTLRALTEGAMQVVPSPRFPVASQRDAEGL